MAPVGTVDQSTSLDAVDEVMGLIDQLEAVLVDLRRLARHMKEKPGDDAAAR